MTSEEENDRQRAMKVLLCGGFAGIITWASIFPLDVIKTRIQTQHLPTRLEQQALIGAPQRRTAASITQRGALEIAKLAYMTEGISVFFRGLGVCSVRAFIVNAVQVCCCHHKALLKSSLNHLIVVCLRMDYEDIRTQVMYRG